MLKNSLYEFIAERAVPENEEMNANQACEMLMQDLDA